jgi:hypothetical protein
MQNVKDLKIHPIDLSEYGKTPTGEPLFRVVWAPTRVEKCWWRETKQFFDVQTYPDCEMWVLEKWMSGLDYAGTPSEFATQIVRSPVGMEYPTDGEYAECMRFPDNEAVSMVKKAVELLLYGKTNITEKERIQALRLREELKERDLDQKTSDAIKDVLDPQWNGKRVKLYDSAGNIIH